MPIVFVDPSDIERFTVEDYCTPGEAARTLGVSPSHVLRYCRNSWPGQRDEHGERIDLIAHNIGGRYSRAYRIARDDLAAFCERWGEHVRQGYAVEVAKREAARAARREIVASLPRSVLAVDIETLGRSPGKSPLVLVGVKSYQLTTGPFDDNLTECQYVGSAYHCFGPEPLLTEEALPATWHFGSTAASELELFLRTSTGPIIGHNLFEFDFRFLRNYIDLRGIVERAVDTLYFAWLHLGKDLLGLSLENLSSAMKSMPGATVPKAWKDGRYREVIAYNEADCDLTVGLWRNWIIGGPLRVQRSTYSPLIVATVTRDDLDDLLGRRSAFSYEEWTALVDRQIACCECGKAIVQRVIVSERHADSGPICRRCAGEQRRQDEQPWIWPGFTIIRKRAGSSSSVPEEETRA